MPSALPVRVDLDLVLYIDPSPKELLGLKACGGARISQHRPFVPDHNPLLRIPLNADCDPKPEDFFLLGGEILLGILAIYLFQRRLAGRPIYQTLRKFMPSGA